jgi:hypothetical protein
MIPTYLERLIHEGKGKLKTFSGAMAEELILTVPDKCYIIIYEYWYRPQLQILGGTTLTGTATWDWRDALQYVNFYNQNNWYSYWHSFFPDFQRKSAFDFPTINPVLTNNYFLPQNGLEFTQYRETYIKADRNLAIYFTRQNPEDVTITNTAVGQFDPLVEQFGYGGETITTQVSGYQALPGAFYSPLSNNLGPVIAPGTVAGWDNSVNCNPRPGGLGGEITNAATYAPNGSQALGKARAQHFQCNYVEVNMENPRNLQ